MEDVMKLCDVIRETGFAIHAYHPHGHMEKIYENALPCRGQLLLPCRGRVGVNS